MPLKRNSPFFRYFFIVQVIGLKTLSIDIKITKLVKKQAMFHSKMEDFKGKQTKNWKCMSLNSP